MCILEMLGTLAFVTGIFTVILFLNRPVPEGKIVITEGLDGKKLFSLELDKTPEEIEAMDVISFKVVPFVD